MKKAIAIIAWLILSPLAGSLLGLASPWPVMGLLIGTFVGSGVGFYRAARVVSPPENDQE